MVLLGSLQVKPDEIIELASRAGEVKYVRVGAQRGTQSRVALVEYTEQPSVIKALQLSGTVLGDHAIRLVTS